MQRTLSDWEGQKTIDLLVLTSLDQPLLLLQISFTLLQNKLATLMGMLRVLSLSLQQGFPVVTVTL
jgi:hypothetical protein